MINLLPQKEKEILAYGRVKNLVMLLGNIIVISLICLILILLSLRFYVLAQDDSQKAIFESAKREYQSPDVVTSKNIMEKYNAVLPQVLSFYQNKIYFSDALAVISEVPKDQGVNFSNISLDGQKYEDKIAVNITGVSDTRDNLLSFQKNIEGQKGVENVVFSPESWINPTKTNFSLTFNLVPALTGLKNGN